MPPGLNVGNVYQNMFSALHYWSKTHPLDTDIPRFFIQRGQRLSLPVLLIREENDDGHIEWKCVVYRYRQLWSKSMNTVSLTLVLFDHMSICCMLTLVSRFDDPLLSGLSVQSHPYNNPSHDDVTKWKHFPRYWPFVRGIHRSPVNSPHKGQWRRALMFSLIFA